MKGNLNKLINQGPITMLRFYSNHKEAWRISKQLKCPYEVVVEEGEIDVMALEHIPLEDIPTRDNELRVLYLTEPQYVMYKLMEDTFADEYIEKIKLGNVTQQMIENYEYEGEWE